MKSKAAAQPLLRDWSVVRLCFFSAAWIHLSVVAVVILNTDLSVDEDPKVRRYSLLKWLLITTWFNLLNLVYFPICIYCEWKEWRKEREDRHVKRVRDVIFTAILFPTIMFADNLFWRLYWKDPGLLSPIGVFKYLPVGGQHSLHTISLIVAILDLITVPREKPERLKPRIIYMTGFYITYIFVVFICYITGEMVYQMLGIMSRRELCLLTIMAYSEYLFYFTVQWFVIDRVWNKCLNKNKNK